MIRRRQFLGTLAGGLLADPLAAGAQPAAKVYRIGLLGGSPPNSPGGRRAWDGFFQGMRELGYVEGQNILVEGRFYGDQTDQLESRKFSGGPAHKESPRPRAPAHPNAVLRQNSVRRRSG